MPPAASRSNTAQYENALALACDDLLRDCGQARDQRHGQASTKCQALHDAGRDSQAREAAGPSPEREAIETRQHDPGLGEQRIDHRQDQLRVAALGEREAQAQIAVQHERRRAGFGGRVEGEETHAERIAD
jgi:hypothetical protein